MTYLEKLSNDVFKPDIYMYPTIVRSIDCWFACSLGAGQSNMVSRANTRRTVLMYHTVRKYTNRFNSM